MANKVNWFPGHMAKTLAQMSKEIKNVDMVIYVLDARAPLSCLNPKFDDLCENKPILYVINKADLAASFQKDVAEILTENVEKAIKEIERISKRYKLHVDPYAKIENITVGMQQRVEILKALFRNARLLILDEPTSVLTPQETKEFFHILRMLRKEGHSIILIAHNLSEILSKEFKQPIVDNFRKNCCEEEINKLLEKEMEMEI